MIRSLPKMTNAMKYFPLFLLFVSGVLLNACQDESLPTVSTNDALKTQLRGTWLPVELALTYQVGVTPTQHDTTVRLTPTTASLLVANRPNPITAFLDTLTFGNQITAGRDTFYVANRGIRQRGYFFVSSASATESLLRTAVPTYTKGQFVRYNFDLVSHGIITLSANNAGTYAPATYANYAYTIKEATSTRLVLSFTSPTNVNNLPQVPVTAANQSAVGTWAGRTVLFTATFLKK